jgi:hypothetical protein
MHVNLPCLSLAKHGDDHAVATCRFKCMAANRCNSCRQSLMDGMRPLTTPPQALMLLPKATTDAWSTVPGHLAGTAIRKGALDKRQKPQIRQAAEAIASRCVQMLMPAEYM